MLANFLYFQELSIGTLFVKIGPLLRKLWKPIDRNLLKKIEKIREHTFFANFVDLRICAKIDFSILSFCFSIIPLRGEATVRGLLSYGESVHRISLGVSGIVQTAVFTIYKVPAKIKVDLDVIS